MKPFFLLALGGVLLGGIGFEVWAHYYWRRRWLETAQMFERLSDRLKAIKEISG